MKKLFANVLIALLLGFGLTSSALPVVREPAVFYKPLKSPYFTVSAYTENPLLNSYISAENLKKPENSASVRVSYPGRGRIVLFAEDTLFRGIWDGTTRVFQNAVVLGGNLSQRFQILTRADFHRC